VAKTRTVFICQQCGNQQTRWLGKCPDCGSWDSFVEQPVTRGGSHAAPMTSLAARPMPITEVATGGFERLPIEGEEFTRVLGGGLVPGSLVLIGGDPGIGKCLTADTRLLDPTTGAYLPLTEWATTLRPVLSLDDTQRLVAQQPAAFLDQGRRPIVEVTTRLGHTLRCTPSHPVLTPDGWRAVGGLIAGTRIATPRALPYFGHASMPEHELKLIAYILSDGSAQSAVSITSALPEVEQDLAKLAAAFGMTLRVYQKQQNAAKQFRLIQTGEQRAAARTAVASALHRVRAARRWTWAAWARAAAVDPAMLYLWARSTCVPSQNELRRLAEAAGIPIEQLEADMRTQADMVTPAAQLLERVGLRFSSAADKTVPAPIFCLPREQLALFLKIMFSCDGSVYVSKNNVPCLSYSTISKQLAQDIQHLLRRFGFITKLRTKPMTVNDQPYTAYELQMLGVREVQRFVAEIGIWGREDAQRRIAALSLPARPSTHFDTVPTGQHFWEALKDASGGISFRDISMVAGTTIRNRRHERPLSRSTVVALADAYPSSTLQALAFGDVYWDEIERIEPAGEEQVFDLSMPGIHNFVANDLIVHNSTLLLQAGATFAEQVGAVLYISAEESAQQLRLRAERLGMLMPRLFVLGETNLDQAINAIGELKPALVVVDSVQTVYLEEISSAAGSVSQVREVALRLLRVAKESGIPIFLVGHVTKEGAIAGPRMLEHIVDVVLYLEGDRFHQYRMLRGVKNRFGSTDEVGVFEMIQTGMREVTNPSQVFLAERSAGTPGSTVAVTMEGTRPILVEVQALTSHTQAAQPRRTANGFDPNRLIMLLAVLSKRVGIPLYNQDVYVNIVGGLRITEPAADVAVAVAIASSYRNQRVDPDVVLVGEVGLSGELRSVSQLERRLGEASKLGFTRSLYPHTPSAPVPSSPLRLDGVRSLDDAIRAALIGKPQLDGEPS
jgi:DNA repair protein RadA/Sms